MWQFHQRLRPFTAISFDLDDTLYDNVPVMLRAEQHVADFLADTYPQTAELDVLAWRALRNQVAAENAELASNMTALRMATLQRTLKEYGIADAERAARAAMAEFLSARNRVEITPEVHALLAQLAEFYPLVAISNGNADVQRIGLGDYFQAAYQPGNGLRGKPFSDMFTAAAQHLLLRDAGQLLHVGDHPVSDVQGAHTFGAQAIWLQPAASGKAESGPATRLPHATISDVQALAALLPR